MFPPICGHEELRDVIHKRRKQLRTGDCSFYVYSLLDTGCSVFETIIEIVFVVELTDSKKNDAGA